ncbi:hypothetical protein LRE50_16300 (plasmid) [Clavibacter sepedonicus]|uniref:FtsK/SpoIIIE domain-containing protein n=1 Tax=Clavibacter sepedonicus TaxID=31964 RepID=UPI002119C63C|nr:FtsK/SpoIIIE domain-containing protein [Clavibacter sepedonicus]UUK67319.1 hypothetical protein LRE50_16300 [Clavibacter sepedonicus]
MNWFSKNSKKQPCTGNDILPTVIEHPGISLYGDKFGDPASPCLYYGVDASGNAIGWELGRTSTAAHVLAITPTGLGGGSLVGSLIVGAVVHSLDIFLIDPKGVEFAPYRGIPECKIASSPEEISAMLDKLTDTLYGRFGQVKGDADGADALRPLVVIVNDFPWIKRDAGATSLEQLHELISLGRSAGIHVLIRAPRPDAELVTGGMRDNLAHLIVLGDPTEQGSLMLWGDARFAERSVSAPDRALVSRGAGRRRRRSCSGSTPRTRRSRRASGEAGPSSVSAPW